MIQPSQQAFVAAARRGNLIPVYRELLADTETPVSAYAKLGGGDYSFLLESVVGGEKWAAYSFIGVAPRAVLTIRGTEATLREARSDGSFSSTFGDEKSFATSDPVAALEELLAKYQPVETAGLPRFWGGAVGWLGYDVVRTLEAVGARPRGADEIAEVCMALTDTVVIFDNLRQTLKIVAAAFIEDGADPLDAYQGACSRIDAIAERLEGEPSLAIASITPPPPTEAGDAALRFGGGAEPSSSFSREGFVSAVEKTKEYILAGDIFQAVLAQQLELPRDGIEPFDIYRALRVVNPSPYMFHLEYPEGRVTGASPETLVRCEAGRVEVRPLAGTRPRGIDADADERLAAELKDDPKECAEHLMLIDLGRNDVGRVAVTGTVFVSQCMEVEHFSHVMHMVSTVSGDLQADCSWADVLRAAFPAGTLSGAPKIRAMQIIDELEPTRRGVYGGAVGYVSYSGNLDLAIAIRTLVTQGDRIRVGVGAGIVADSDAVAEFEETLNKARGVLRAVALAGAAT